MTSGDNSKAISYTIASLKINEYFENDDLSIDSESFNTYSASGILIFLNSTHNFCILSSSPLFISSNRRLRIQATWKQNVEDDSVEWYPFQLKRVSKLQAVGELLKTFSKNGFLPIPSCESDALGMAHIALLVSSKPLDRIIKPGSLQYLNISGVNNILNRSDEHHLYPLSISVRSTPFAQVNTALFMGYRSAGTLSYVYRSGSEKIITALLSDIRYLDGMNGAAAFCKRHESVSGQDELCIGMVLGSLKKMNGEGELTVIVPWDLIFEQPSFVDCLIQSTSDFIPEEKSKKVPLDLQNAYNESHGVLCISVSRPGGRRTWGSGILLNESLIVTNLHVVSGVVSSIMAYTVTGKYQLEIIGSPLNGFDLIFLRPRDAIRDIKPSKLTSSGIKSGCQVISIGYGLFYPLIHDQIMQPLFSEGRVSKVFRMRVYERRQDKNFCSNPSIPVMIISSASCWNGSSGGGLFESKTKDLVGMMTSNGRIKDSGELIPQMAFVIPSEVIQLAVNLFFNNRTIMVSNRVQTLWELGNTHKNIENDERRSLSAIPKL